ncbi:trypsin domain-containing protein [Phthorimaea operculella]|nr:trypsin domain-containing protein [Phthorimaea operculella]
MPPKPGSMCCGVDTSSLDGIIGGSPASLKQYPWLAWIEEENIRSEESYFVCGGSLISGLYVLTAGYCVKDDEDKRLSNVYLSDYNKSHTGPDCIEENGAEICFRAVKIAIERTFQHGDYDSEARNKGIGLIKLAKMAPYTAAKALNSSDDNTASTTTPDDGDDDEIECVLSEMPPKPGSMCCGVDATSLDGIVGGSQALLKQYPWLAVIEQEYIRTKETQFVCGGSLISGLYVLTAAHCVEEEKHTRLTNVYLGAYNMSHTGPDCIEENGEEICFKTVKIAIERIIGHEDYDDDTKYNDIALIKLAKMAPYTEFVRLICLPMLDLNMAAHKHVWLTVAGWGSINKERWNQINPDIKKHVELPFVPLERCVVEEHDVTSTQICAGGKEGEDSCFGDQEVLSCTTMMVYTN